MEFENWNTIQLFFTLIGQDLSIQSTILCVLYVAQSIATIPIKNCWHIIILVIS